MIERDAYEAAEHQRNLQREQEARAAHLQFLAQQGASSSQLKGLRKLYTRTDRDRDDRQHEARA